MTPAALGGTPEPTRLRFARAVCSRLQPFGAGKAGRYLYPYERAKRDGFRFSVRAKTGSRFTGTTADFHAYPFAFSGCSEWRNWALAMAVCRPGDVIAEIGANVGTETVGFSDIVGADGRVLAFEPLPGHLQALAGVIDDLRHQNVTVMPYAVSDQEATAAFALPPAAMSQGIGHLLGPEESNTGTVSYYDRPVETTLIQVQTRPLDTFAAQLRGLRLLVADAEGAELKILRGAGGVLASERPVLVLEASQPHQRRAGFSIELLHVELSALGYVAFDIGLLKLTEVSDPRTGAAHSDWLCIPNERVQEVRSIERFMRRCALRPCVFGLNPLTRPASR